MPTPPSATWQDPDTELFEAGDFLRTDQFEDNVLAPIYWLGTQHNHDGGAGDGGTLATADPKAIWYYGAVGGGPFG